MVSGDVHPAVARNDGRGESEREALSRREPATVALVEDHKLLAVGVAALMETAGDLCFIGTFDTAPQLLEHCGEAGLPDVVLLDLRLADASDPRENVELLRERGCEVVAYTSGEDPYLVRRACEGGVLGVALKSGNPDTLIATIRAAVRGELTPSVEWASALDTDQVFVTQMLSETERRVLTLYAAGAQADYVARQLGLAKDTVNTYIYRIRRRFLDAGRRVDSRVDLFRLAQAEGILPTLPGHE